MGNSLLDAAAATFDHAINGKSYPLAFLSYREQAEVTAEAIRREKDSVAADAKAAGVTGELLYERLRAVQTSWDTDDERDPFVRAIFSGGLDDALRRVLRRTEPKATDEQIEAMASAIPPQEHLSIVKKAANLKDKEPNPPKAGEASDPQAGAATGQGASPASQPATAA